MILIVMGAAGCGKTTVARLLADQAGWDFLEGDVLHPPANVAKMAAGHPLTDADREPWLAAIAAWIDARIAADRSAAVACSALKRRYRDVLRRPQVRFAYLRVPRDVLAARLASRPAHYMPASLLDSQLADLEPPGPDENALTVDADRPAADVVAAISERLAADSPR